MQFLEGTHKTVLILGLLVVILAVLNYLLAGVGTEKEAVQQAREAIPEQKLASPNEQPATVTTANFDQIEISEATEEEAVVQETVEEEIVPEETNETIESVVVTETLPVEEEEVPEDGEHEGITLTDCATLRQASPFYADMAAQVIKKERQLRNAGMDDEAALLREISCFPHSTWILGSNSLEETVAKIERVTRNADRLGKVPVFVLYNHPTHVMAGWNSGRTGAEYLSWITAVKDAIGDTPVWVILEPDALPTVAEYNLINRQVRTEELGEAVSIFSESPNIRVYIDAGHSAWLGVDEAVQLLTEANVMEAHGFALNVANFRKTEHEQAYGDAIAAKLGGKRFVIDTARNGNGPHPDSEWCNASGRAIGEKPRFVPEDPYLDALLWVKPAGESDGTCNGGPTPGIFWTEYALDLVRTAQEN